MLPIQRRLAIRWFSFFFVCIGSIRFWEMLFSPSNFNLWRGASLFCHVACVAYGLTLLQLCSRRIALLFLALLAVLYIASEHHLFVQGAYLTSRELVHYSVFSPQLFHGYWTNIYWSVLASGLLVLGASFALFFMQLPFDRSLKPEKNMRHRAVSGALTLTFFGVYVHISTGPLATFVLPLIYAFLPEISQASQNWDHAAFTSTSIFSPEGPLAHHKPSTGGERFNVVLIHMESTGDLSSRHNGERFLTSQERLAATGITWENAYAPAPHTGKSIFAVQTGQYGPAKVSNPIASISREHNDCIANNFKKAGYRTAFLAANYFHFYSIQRLKEICDYDQMMDARQVGKTEPDYINGLGTDESAMFSRAISWATESNEPFFLTLQTVLPHWPYVAPPSWSSPNVSPDDRHQQYQNSISYVDSTVNRFIDELERHSLRDNTIIVFFGDHGEAFLEHPNNLIHGAELYEENVRIPFVISNPKLTPRASTSKSLASLVDVAPTLFDILGMPWDGSRYDGTSLFSAPPNRMVFMVSDLLGDKYGLRDGNYKFIHTPTSDSAYLFNLQEDPKETNNLGTQSPERKDFYVKAIQSWINHTRRANAG